MQRWVPIALMTSLLVVSVPIAASQEPGREQPIAPVVSLRPAMLAGHIDRLAGQTVTVLDARVVDVLEPHALLVEPDMRGLASFDQRYRVLVLLSDATLPVEPELLVKSTVTVTGVARSLLAMQASKEVPWPGELDRDRLDRLDVRASVLATSVRTPDGVELTQRR